ncbi:hypothetical protein HDV57DRAFT_92197 [Trichoderma longibrachiatum]
MLPEEDARLSKRCRNQSSRPSGPPPVGLLSDIEDGPKKNESKSCRHLASSWPSPPVAHPVPTFFENRDTNHRFIGTNCTALTFHFRFSFLRWLDGATGLAFFVTARWLHASIELDRGTKNRPSRGPDRSRRGFPGLDLSRLFHFFFLSSLHTEITAVQMCPRADGNSHFRMVPDSSFTGCLNFLFLSFSLPPGFFLANEIRPQLLRSCNAGSDCRLQYIVGVPCCDTIEARSRYARLSNERIRVQTDAEARPSTARTFNSLGPSDYLVCANKTCTSKPCNQRLQSKKQKQQQLITRRRVKRTCF